MANISHGMNVHDVNAMGVRLQQHHSATITALMNEIDRLVNDTANTWVGPDAVKFRGWWPAKRAALKAVADDLHGFGQSAINNAKEQSDVSGR